jgi:hypothetical protein
MIGSNITLAFRELKLSPLPRDDFIDILESIELQIEQLSFRNLGLPALAPCHHPFFASDDVQVQDSVHRITSVIELLAPCPINENFHFDFLVAP